MNPVHRLPREGYERPANLGSAKANGEKDKVVSYSKCEGYLVFEFQNLDSKMFTVSFLFLPLMDYCMVIFVCPIKPLQPILVPICPYTHTTQVPSTCI